MVRRKILFSPLLLLSLLMCTQVKAQEECFEYGDAAKTIITGLSVYGEAATELTIPAQVTDVLANALAYRNPNLSALVIENGNPIFDANVWGGNLPLDLSLVKMGNAMSVDNMKKVLLSLETANSLSKVEIDGYTPAGNISWTDTDIKAVLTSGVNVVLPAELVAAQVFGDAKVFGRFETDKEIISFCCNATFLDDGASNMLFYVADGIVDNKIHIQRVWYVAKGKGILIHRTGSYSGYAEVERIGDIDDYSDAQAIADKTSYFKNMLVGVTAPTAITAIDGDYTNLILKDGSFHPTSGGTIKANRAYLHVHTASVPSAASSLEIDFEDETGIGALLNDKEEMINDKWYTLDGRKLSEQPTAKGIYIHNGKKVMMK